MSSNRSSATALIVRLFLFVLVLSVGSSLFWNGLSGREMFPLLVAIIVAVVVTAFLLVIGFVVVTIGGNALLGNDPNYQKWKAQGGRPYWDSLPPPINTDSPETRGFAERPRSEAPTDDD
jgi:hypothetical protein